MAVLRSARREDDPALRALLRDRPFEGALRLTLEREPCFFHAAAVEGSPHHVFLGETAGRPAGLFSRAVRPVWHRGRPARLGYLGQLRTSSTVTLTRRHLRRGFAACEATRTDRELPFDLTSIVADNAPARRLLERGLPGLPVYQPWTEWVTLVIPRARRSDRPGDRDGIERGTAERMPEIVRHLDAELSTRELAPRWTLADLTSPQRTRGLEPEDFLLLREPAGGGSHIRACLALWDQRGFKQTVIRGYAPWLALLRPVLSPVLALSGRPRLPPRGTSLAMAFLSHEAAPMDRPELLARLVEAARRRASARGLEYLVLGLSRSDPRLPRILERFRCRVYDSVLYLVHRPEDAVRRAVERAVASPAPPHAEVALL